jgi:hypothetical protein
VGRVADASAACRGAGVGHQGPLGLKFVEVVAGQVEVLAINPGTQATRHPALVPGLVLQTIGEVAVAGRGHTVVQQTLTKHRSQRPLRLRFSAGARARGRVSNQAALWGALLQTNFKALFDCRLCGCALTVVAPDVSPPPRSSLRAAAGAVFVSQPHARMDRHSSVPALPLTTRCASL